MSNNVDMSKTADAQAITADSKSLSEKGQEIELKTSVEISSDQKSLQSSLTRSGIIIFNMHA